MRIKSRKVLSPTQRVLVEDACAPRGVELELEERGGWMAVRMSGEAKDVAAAWAEIRAGRNECSAS